MGCQMMLVVYLLMMDINTRDDRAINNVKVVAKICW